MTQRNQYDSRFKATVALEAIQNQRTIAQIASEYGGHPNQVTQWKQQLLETLPDLFTNGRKKAEKDHAQLVAELYRQSGQLKVEVDWLKKKQAFSVEQKRALIEPTLQSISIARQCELLGLARSSFYATPAGESEQNVLLMRLLDEQYTQTP